MAVGPAVRVCSVRKVQCSASGYKFAKGGSCCLSGQMTPNGTCCPRRDRSRAAICASRLRTYRRTVETRATAERACVARQETSRWRAPPVVIRHKSPRTAFAVPPASRPIRADDRPASSRQPPAAVRSSTANAARRDKQPPAGPRQRCCPAGQKPDDRYQSTIISLPPPAPAACPDGSPIPASGSMSRRTAFSLCTGPRATRHAVCLPEHRQAADVEARRLSVGLLPCDAPVQQQDHTAGSAAVAKLRSGTSAA